MFNTQQVRSEHWFYTFSVIVFSHGRIFGCPLYRDYTEFVENVLTNTHLAGSSHVLDVLNAGEALQREPQMSCACWGHS